MIGREANYAAFSADDFGTKKVLSLDVSVASEEQRRKIILECPWTFIIRIGCTIRPFVARAEIAIRIMHL
jgi:hypothetical protein